jgi:hypothetical protein
MQRHQLLLTIETVATSHAFMRAAGGELAALSI